MTGTGTALQDLLVYAVLPLWLAAGFADYLCHRAADIEHANGPRESLLHWLMLGEVGAPLLAAIFLKINALLFAFMLLCWIAHELTTHIDLALAIRTRRVSAFEQQVHSFLEVLPLVALLLLAVLHWDQARALFGFGPAVADLSLTHKTAPPLGELLTLFAALTLFGGIPYADELWRGIRAARRANDVEKQP